MEQPILPNQISIFDQHSPDESHHCRIGNITHINTHPGYYRKNHSKSHTTRMPISQPARCQTMQPIRDTATRELIEQELLYSSDEYGYRNWLIWKLGINIGRRCGDLLTLRLQDVWDEDSKSVKDPIIFYEEKTKKKAVVRLNSELREEVTSFILSLPNRTPQTPLFSSYKSSVNKVDPNGKPRLKDDTGCLTVGAYRRILNDVAEKLGLEYLGTHSMRKTYGYCFYQKFKGQLIDEEYTALDVLQSIFNHSSPRQTLRYIGLEREACLKTFDELIL